MGGLGWWVAGVATGGWAGGRTVGRTGKRTMTQVSDAMDSYGFLRIPMDSYGFLWIPIESQKVHLDSWGHRWAKLGWGTHW
jgi:hypothetical protein